MTDDSFQDLLRAAGVLPSREEQARREAPAAEERARRRWGVSSTREEPE